MQAINDAAMVSRLNVEDVADLYAATCARSGTPMDRDAALTALETEFLLGLEGIRRPRIVLIASDFPPSVTATVVWLNEQQVDISLIRYRLYQVGDRTVVSFSRLYPVPDVEEFTIGRRVDQATKSAEGPGTPWDEPSLRRLVERGNPATLAMLDLCAALDASEVTVKDVAKAAGITEGAVRGQLAGLTMRIRNRRYGYTQTDWPVNIGTTHNGAACDDMDPDLAAIWRSIGTNEDLKPVHTQLQQSDTTDS